MLLIHTHIPDSGALIWLAPGGGLEPGEDPKTGLIREVSEETRLQITYNTDIVGPVWHRRHKFHLHGQAYDQAEEYFLVVTTKFEADSSANPAQQEKDIFRGFRWWSLDDILASENIFVPLTFGQHLRNLLVDGPPPSCIDVGK